LLPLRSVNLPFLLVYWSKGKTLLNIQTMHTTNYYHTFIQVAEDCPAKEGEMPPLRGGKKTIAGLQFETLYENPYRYTSDEVLFGVFAERKELAEGDLEAAREAFFAKGQPCFRASPLSKKYGWGVHSDGEGKIAIYAVDSKDYQRLANDPELKQVRAMRSSRK
jgi:hypothetical protein